MSQIDYSQMSDRELKQYFLAHRDDNEAFHAYMDRRHQKKLETIVEAGEIDHLPIEEQIEIVAQRIKPLFNKKQ